mgnify:CR=1 FL=1|jgi:hypothetical protein
MKGGSWEFSDPNEQLMSEIKWAQAHPYAGIHRESQRDAAVLAAALDLTRPLYLRGPNGRIFTAFPLGKKASSSMGLALPCPLERHLKMSGVR